MLVGAAGSAAGGGARVGIALAPARGSQRAPRARAIAGLLEEMGRREQNGRATLAEAPWTRACTARSTRDWAGELVERLLISPQADAAMRRLLDGPVVDRLVVPWSRRAWWNGRPPS